MGVREDRLENDYRGLQRLCIQSDAVKIKILNKSGNPPESYRIQLSNCKGIECLQGNTPKYRTEHILIIGNFPQAYPDPGQLPIVKLETPIFHPNVFPDGSFCFRGSELEKISQPLDALVRRVITMIQYENLRFGRPANGAANNWANQNKHLFPLSVNSGDGGQSKPTLNWR